MTGKPTEQVAEEQVKVLTIEKTTPIVEKMQRMATLLELGGYAEWSASIFKLAKKYEHEPDDTKHIFLNLYGGMGSLNDLVLYRNGKVLMSENDELDQLRRDLFNLLS
ncbi:hypothetical protein G7090_17995 [Leclercia sp. 29361]|uniref:DUF6966 domain-containing protein n=1 Tax=Leclercia sp. 29361 TaxID=2714951 RepID=UPI00140E2DC4|nr:hypothetical protein [Leclercia sp. 29361]QIK11847.1 hypothetical protein G7090_17995 [Leclercia sp. 29361]